MSGARILIVEDEKLLRWSIRDRLQEEGHVVIEAADGAAALPLLRRGDLDLALLDLQLPDTTGLKLLEEARAADPSLPCMLITAFASVDSAVSAMKLGAYDYLGKPVDFDQLALTVQRGLEMTRLRREVRALRRGLESGRGPARILSRSKVMEEVFRVVERVAPTDATVLIRGESGTGKGLVARAIHAASPRSGSPFLTVTCTALQETLLESELMGHERGAFTDAKDRKKGLFELADGGTLFLDEIGDVSPSFQAKLLQLLEDKTFRRVGGTEDLRADVRILVATHRDLEDAVKEGHFREDLYYRLKIIPLEMPPLREREGDVSVLAQHFIDQFAAEFGSPARSMSKDALAVLEGYGWPGNVRELRNVIERMVLLSGAANLDVTDVPREILGDGAATPAEEPEGAFQLPAGGLQMEDLERGLVEQALRRTRGNQTRAARLLGMNREQIRYRVEKFGLRELIESLDAE
ncbi:MAG: sigma-54-dependent transcriptional regulator [Planctomycetota bacterium]|jgi:DNA-binding NtrC family response regulator